MILKLILSGSTSDEPSDGLISIIYTIVLLSIYDIMHGLFVGNLFGHDSAERSTALLRRKSFSKTSYRIG